MQNDTKVTVFKALSDPTRLRIVTQLAQCPSESKSCSDLSSSEELSQPALSHHFAKLAAAGIVYEQKSGTHKSYELNRELLAECGIDADKLV